MKKLFYLIPLFSLLGFAGAAYASTIANTPNLFETYLANSEGSTDTSMVLASAALRDGSTLSGFTCFTVDSNTPTVEYECGTVSGTNVTGLIRGIDAVTGTTTIASLQYAHHRGADVKVTDYPTLTILSRIFQNVDTIPNPISYISSLATTTIAANRANVASVGLVQDIAFGGAGIINASATNKGIVQISTGAQAAASTVTGSTGASLALTSSISTSTFNSATAANVVVLTQNSGKIDSNFLGNLASTTIVGSTFAFDIGKHEQVFTSSSTFAIPNGIRTVYAKIVGGGGSGAVDGSSQQCSGGGGSGAYGETMIDVSATTSLTINIGAGGLIAGSQGVGGLGSTTSIASVMSASGGSGGNRASTGGSTSSSGGQGGVGGQTIVGATASSTGTNGSGCFVATLSDGSHSLLGIGGPSVLGMYGSGGADGANGNNGAVILYW